MDRWKAKELRQMENGGNKLAREFYEANGMMDADKPDHKNPALQRYKNELKAKVDKAMGVLPPVKPIETPVAPLKEAKPEEMKTVASKNDDLAAMLSEPVPVAKKETSVKKPRAFIAESDLFDFSDIKIVTGGNNVPKALDDQVTEILEKKNSEKTKKIE